MTESQCQTIRDRMPDMADGRSTWTAPDDAHLKQCGECAAEWRLIASAARLGNDVAAAVKPEAMAAMVMEQLHTEAKVIHFRRRVALIGGLAAAAAAIALIVGPMLRSGSSADAVPDRAWLVPELDSLETSELILVLDGLDPTFEDGTFGPDVPSVDDLEAQELERVLQAWES